MLISTCVLPQLMFIRKTTMFLKWILTGSVWSANLNYGLDSDCDELNLLIFLQTLKLYLKKDFFVILNCLNGFAWSNMLGFNIRNMKIYPSSVASLKI